MRTLKLKEKDSDMFLRLEETENGAALVAVTKTGEVLSYTTLTLKQMSNVREWMCGRQDEWFKKHRVTSGGKNEKGNR